MARLGGARVARVRTGRDVCRILRAFERRWEEGHRRPVLHPWERSRVLDGDFRALTRELEPAFQEGQKLVLSYSRSRGALVRDPTTGEEIYYPKPPREDLFWIEIERVVRHRSGYWRVHFRAWDRRQDVRLVRRTPPVHAPGEEDDEAPDAEQVAIESAYTTNPTEAVDHLQAVPREFQAELTVTARDRWGEYESVERRRQVAERQGRQLTRKLRALQRESEELGVDITPRLVSMIREAEAALAEARQAAAA